MAVFKQDVSIPVATYRVGTKRFPMTADRLKAYTDNTNRMIASGVEVPLFRSHKNLGDPTGGPVIPESKTEARDEDHVGWVKKITFDGQKLGYELNVKDEEHAKKLREQQVKFTSPEFAVKDYIDGLGRNWGPVVRHVAFPTRPRNPVQSSISELEEVAFDEIGEYVALSFADMDEPAEKEVLEVEEEQPKMPKPDADPDGDRIAKCTEHMQGIQSIFSALSITIPTASFTNAPDTFMEQLHTALQEVQMKAHIEPTKSLKEEGGVLQYSELADHPDPQVRSMFAQFSEAENAKKAIAKELASKQIQDKIGSSWIPTPIRQKILAKVENVQFSEDGESMIESPCFTASEVAELISAAMPKNYQFSEVENSATEVPPPEQFMEKPIDNDPSKITREQAKKIAEATTAGFNLGRVTQELQGRR